MNTSFSYDLENFDDKERKLFKKSMVSKKWVPSNVETTYSKQILNHNMDYCHKLEWVRRAIAVSQIRSEVKGAFDFALDHSNRVRRLPRAVNFHAQVGNSYPNLGRFSNY